MQTSNVRFNVVWVKQIMKKGLGENLAKKSKIKVIPLGGLNEIGKNMYLFEYENEILVVDAGLAFPDEEMFGVDLVIPDITYLEKNKDKVKGIVLTHGHEDHIGALPYVLKKLDVPVYGTRFTIGLVENKLKEHNLLGKVKLSRVRQGDKVKLGRFIVEFIHSNHSIVDAVILAIHTPEGVIVHTGDFKIDCTPIDGPMIDLARLGELGKKGVLALLSDSTNVERPGYTMSERIVGETFEEIFQKAKTQRIIVATFASNVHRVQQIINAAVKHNRKVAVSGRSMENVVEVATTLGYMDIPQGTLVELDQIDKYPPHKLVICTTGSQGEPMAALSRMAMSDHRQVEIGKGDLVVISASPIPGNEKSIAKVIDELFKHGADVLYKSLADIHVSGHACQEELKIMMGVTKPKYFIPVHGDYRYLVQHAKLAYKMGIPQDNVFVMENGKVLEISKNEAKIAGSVPSGKVLVDGLGVGDVGNIVLRDRKHLSQDGIIVVVVTIDGKTKEVVAGPDIISRGFVYVREAEGLMEEVKQVAQDSLATCKNNKTTDWTSIKNTVKSHLTSYLFQKTKRRPMILPVIMEV